MATAHAHLSAHVSRQNVVCFIALELRVRCHSVLADAAVFGAQVPIIKLVATTDIPKPPREGDGTIIADTMAPSRPHTSHHYFT